MFNFIDYVCILLSLFDTYWCLCCCFSFCRHWSLWKRVLNFLNMVVKESPSFVHLDFPV